VLYYCGLRLSEHVSKLRPYLPDRYIRHQHAKVTLLGEFGQLRKGPSIPIEARFTKCLRIYENVLRPKVRADIPVIWHRKVSPLTVGQIRTRTKSSKTACKTFRQNGAKYWSGRRESNPRMQLGKLGSSVTYQELSYKAHAFGI
jgi:hypothetical protein